MIKDCAKKLDKWLIDENKERAEKGTVPLKCTIKVIGQTALIEAGLKIQLAATMDVDLSQQLNGIVRKRLAQLLAGYGKQIDPVGHEAWMPDETEYQEVYTGEFVECFIAKPEYILISKAKMAPSKNKNLIIEYLGTSPTSLFFELATRYGVTLEDFLK